MHRKYVLRTVSFSSFFPSPVLPSSSSFSFPLPSFPLFPSHLLTHYPPFPPPTIPFITTIPPPPPPLFFFFLPSPILSSFLLYPLPSRILSPYLLSFPPSPLSYYLNLAFPPSPLFSSSSFLPRLLSLRISSPLFSLHLPSYHLSFTSYHIYFPFLHCTSYRERSFASTRPNSSRMGSVYEGAAVSCQVRSSGQCVSRLEWRSGEMWDDMRHIGIT